MGCSGGMSTICCTRIVLEIWSSSVYFLGKRQSLLHPNMAQGSFFQLQSYSKKTLRKKLMPRKVLVNTKGIVLMPPGHPIILLKSNLFNTAVLLLKRSIARSNFFLTHCRLPVTKLLLMLLMLVDSNLSSGLHYPPLKRLVPGE